MRSVGAFFRRFLHLILLGLLLLGGRGQVLAQTGKEFWFDMPEVNRGHVNSQYNYPIYLHVSTLDDPASCTLELPADTAHGFTPITFTIPANSKKRIQLTDPHSNTSNFTNPDIPMSLYWKAFKDFGGDIRDCPDTERPKYIENVLGWSESNLLPADGRPYINRTNKGVKLTATSTIMAYVEIAVGWNMDLIALKGENAKGKHFFVPMQTDLNNSDLRYNGMNCRQYPSINIVGTLDNTKIKINVPRPIWVHNKKAVGHPYGEVLPAGEHILWLNAGQSSIIVPYEKNFNKGGNAYQTPIDAGKRLEGTEITVLSDDGSGGDIVVTTRDDLVISTNGNPDVVIDQLVPVEHAGMNFGIIRGVVGPHRDEFIYVVGTEDGTTVNVGGVSGVTSFSLDRGKQRSIRIGYPSGGGVAVTSDKPVYVFHMSGAGSSSGGDQKAGALIPALPAKEICIGSKEVAFSRTKGGLYIFYMNVLAWDDSKDPANTSIGHFELQQQGTGGFVPVTGAQLLVQNHLNDPTNWKPLPLPAGTPADSPLRNWKYLQINTDAIGAGIQDGAFAYRLINTNNVFHLGLLNGSPGQDAFYGYFSDFSQVQVAAKVTTPKLDPITGLPVIDAVTGLPELEAVEGGSIDLCRGEGVKLGSPSNKHYRYAWNPPTYLNATNVNEVEATNVRGDITYTVTVTGMCDLALTAEVKLNVSPHLEFDLAGPSKVCGEGDVDFYLSNIRHTDKVEWTVQTDPAGVYGPLPSSVDGTNQQLDIFGVEELVHPVKLEYPDPPPSGGGPVTYRVKVKGDNVACERTVIQEVKLFPKLAKPTITASSNPASLCSPVGVTFNVQPTTYAPNTKFRWRLGNGDYVSGLNPGTVVFTNSEKDPKLFEHKLTVTDEFGVCKDSASVVTQVFPEVQAKILLSPREMCEPWNPPIKSTLHGNTGQKWSLYRGSSPTPFFTSNNATFSLSTALVAQSNAPETYRVTLEANNGACSAQDEQEFTVNPQPRGNVKEPTYPAGKSCSPLRVRVEVDGIVNVDSYKWEVKETKYGVAKPLNSGGAMGGATLTLDEEFTNDGSSPVYRWIVLTLTNRQGCSFTREIRIEVPPTLEASFLANSISGCPDASGKFTGVLVNSSVVPAGSEYGWYVNGVEIQALKNQETFSREFTNTSFTTPLEQKVRMVIKSPSGCTAYDEADVVVYPMVNPSFTALDDGGKPFNPSVPICAPRNATFTAKGAAKYQWDFFDRSRATGPVVAKSLENTSGVPSTYTIKLRGYNDYGCSADASQVFTLNPEVKASFVSEVIEPCNPVVVQITNESQPATGLTFSWSFEGGGMPDDPDSPRKVTYTLPGTHTIKLTAQDAYGCKSDAEPRLVNVEQPVRAAIAPLTIEQASVCAPGAITFASNTSGADYVLWDFGDGKRIKATPAQSVTHTFSNDTNLPKDYRVTLTAGSDLYGCEDAPNSKVSTLITIYPEVRPRSEKEVLDWCSPVSLSLSNTSENADYFEWSFTPVVAAFGRASTLPTAALGPQTVSLPNSSPDQMLDYKIKFTASKKWSGGPQCAATVDLGKVTVPPVFKQDITVSTPFACSGSELEFTNNSSGGSISHSWDFDDKTEIEHTTARGKKRHTFYNMESGRVDVVRNVKIVSSQTAVPGGCTKTLTLPITVHPYVKSTFATELADVCAVPFSVTFKNASTISVSATGVTTEYRWDMGDGTQYTKSDKLDFTHEYQSSFSEDAEGFVASLLVDQLHENSGLHCTDNSTSSELSVAPLLKPSITASVTEGCGKLTVTFRSTTTGGRELRYRWDFGDDDKEGAVGREVTHEYSNRTSTTQVYTAHLYVTNEYGCRASASVDITVHPEVKADFTVNWSDRCTPFDVEVVNGSLNGHEYIWELIGDAQTVPTMTDRTPFTLTMDNTTAESDKTVTLRLLAKSIHGGFTCSHSTEKSIIVPPRLVAGFTLSEEAGCNPLEVTFANSSTGKVTRSDWDFGGVSASTLATPEPQRFVNESKEVERVLPIKLRVTNADGCVAEIEKSVTVYPKVESSFAADAYSGCTPLSVNFKSISQSPAYSYDWQLGGGHTNATAAEPATVVYENKLGSSTVFETDVKLVTYLTAHPECKHSDTKRVQVFPQIAPSFSAVDGGCPTLEFSVANGTVAYPGAVEYNWYLDGMLHSTLAAPDFELDNFSPVDAKEYTIRLDATSVHGCNAHVEKVVTVYPRPRAAFEFDEGRNASCPPLQTVLHNKAEGNGLTFDYDFGNGQKHQTTDPSEVIAHAFDNLDSDVVQYSITQNIVSEDGCTDVAAMTAYIYPRVRADFVVQPGNSGCSPFVVSMQNSSTNASDYEWDFGDGGSSASRDPGHRYVNTGTTDLRRTVSLRALSRYGCEDTKSLDVMVRATPKAMFALTPTTQTYPNSTVQIDNQSSPADDDWSYSWDFGDGRTSRSKDPLFHTYEHWGGAADNFSYTISLTVENVYCSDETKKSIIILPSKPMPDFSADQFEGCPPLKVQFFNTSLYATEYFWDFGDGTTSELPEPEHVFRKTGKYRVRLTTRGDGGEDFRYAEVEVLPTPNVSFEAQPELTRFPDTEVQMVNLTDLGHSYLWNFGDGGVSTETSPTHAYSEPGEYEVTLVAMTEKGCADTLVKAKAVVIIGDGELKFPSAFKPDPNGPSGGVYPLGDDLENKVFHPFLKGTVREYKLMIFNRWGEQIFESDDIAKGWDGYLNGNLAPMGVYGWRAVGTFPDGTLFNLKGNVTLMR